MRFIVIKRSDERIPEYERAESGWAIYDTGRNVVVGYDGGDPEDQLLIRDWRWVALALNSTAEECRQTKTALREATAVLQAIRRNMAEPYRGDPNDIRDVAFLQMQLDSRARFDRVLALCEEAIRDAG